MDLNKVILKPDEKKKSEDILVTYLSGTRGRHNAYAFRYFVCEVLNFFNVIIQMASFWSTYFNPVSINLFLIPNRFL
jgi:hypothetical protein